MATGTKMKTMRNKKYFFRMISLAIGIIFLLEQIAWTAPVSETALHPPDKTKEDKTLFAVHYVGETLQRVSNPPGYSRLGDSQKLAQIKRSLAGSDESLVDTGSLTVKDGLVRAKIRTETGWAEFLFYPAEGGRIVSRLTGTPVEVAAKDTEGRPVILAQRIGIHPFSPAFALAGVLFQSIRDIYTFVTEVFLPATLTISLLGFTLLPAQIVSAQSPSPEPPTQESSAKADDSLENGIVSFPPWSPRIHEGASSHEARIKDISDLETYSGILQITDRNGNPLKILHVGERFSKMKDVSFDRNTGLLSFTTDDYDGSIFQSSSIRVLRALVKCADRKVRPVDIRLQLNDVHKKPEPPPNEPPVITSTDNGPVTLDHDGIPEINLAEPVEANREIFVPFTFTDLEEDPVKVKMYYYDYAAFARYYGGGMHWTPPLSIFEHSSYQDAADERNLTIYVDLDDGHDRPGHKKPALHIRMKIVKPKKPAKPGEIVDQKEFFGKLYFCGPPKPIRFNRANLGSFEMGNTFKAQFKILSIPKQQGEAPKELEIVSFGDHPWFNYDYTGHSLTFTPTDDRYAKKSFSIQVRRDIDSKPFEINVLFDLSQAANSPPVFTSVNGREISQPNSPIVTMDMGIVSLDNLVPITIGYDDPDRDIARVGVNEPEITDSVEGNASDPIVDQNTIRYFWIPSDRTKAAARDGNGKVTLIFTMDDDKPPRINKKLWLTYTVLPAPAATPLPAAPSVPSTPAATATTAAVSAPPPAIIPELLKIRIVGDREVGKDRFIFFMTAGEEIKLRVVATNPRGRKLTFKSQVLDTNPRKGKTPLKSPSNGRIEPDMDSNNSALFRWQSATPGIHPIELTATELTAAGRTGETTGIVIFVTVIPAKEAVSETPPSLPVTIAAPQPEDFWSAFFRWTKNPILNLAMWVFGFGLIFGTYRLARAKLLERRMNGLIGRLGSVDPETKNSAIYELTVIGGENLPYLVKSLADENIVKSIKRLLAADVILKIAPDNTAAKEYLIKYPKTGPIPVLNIQTIDDVAISAKIVEICP